MSDKSNCSRTTSRDWNYHGFRIAVVRILTNFNFQFHFGGWGAILFQHGRHNWREDVIAGKDGGCRHYRVFLSIEIDRFDSIASNIKTVVQDGRSLTNTVFRARKSETFLKRACRFRWTISTFYECTLRSFHRGRYNSGKKEAIPSIFKRYNGECETMLRWRKFQITWILLYEIRNVITQEGIIAYRIYYIRRDSINGVRHALEIRNLRGWIVRWMKSGVSECARWLERPTTSLILFYFVRMSWFDCPLRPSFFLDTEQKWNDADFYVQQVPPAKKYRKFPNFPEHLRKVDEWKNFR